MEKGDKCMRMKKIIPAILGSLIIVFLISINLFATITEYDVSLNGDGSIMAVLDTETGTLTVSGSGITKNYTSKGPWSNSGYVKHIVVEEGVTELGNYLFVGDFYNLETITLPDSLTRIGERCFYYTSSSYTSKVTNLVIPKNVKTIEKEAFYWYTGNRASITNIYIPKSVETIGDGVFKGQAKLINLTFEEGSQLKNIGNESFYGCSILEELNLPVSVVSIGNYAFQGMDKLKTFNDLSTSIQTLGIDIFGIGTNNYMGRSATGKTAKAYVHQEYMINALKGLGYTVTVLEGTEALDKLKSYPTSTLFEVGVVNPSDVIAKANPYAGTFDFEGSGNIKDYTTVFNSNIGDIAQTPWNGTNIPTRIKKITVGEGITSLGDSLFAYVNYMGGMQTFGNVEDIVLPSTLTRIGNRTFFMGGISTTYKLTSIIIPKNVETIGDYAFKLQKSLTSFAFESQSKLKSIGKESFYAVSAKKIELPEGFTTVGESAFYSATVEELTLPTSTKSIGLSAFHGMNNLKVFNNLSTTTQTIGKDIFGSSSSSYTGRSATGKTATIYEHQEYMIDALKGLGYTVTVLTGTESLNKLKSYPTDSLFEMGAVNPTDVIGKLNGYANTIELIGVGNTKNYASRPWGDASASVTKITVREGITGLGDYLFRNLKQVESVTLPDSLTYIGNRCFEAVSGDGVKLTSITIPKNVESIGDYAFLYRTGLKNIYFAQGSKLTSIGNYAFFYCSGLEEMILPDGVKTIGEGAFKSAGATGFNLVLNEGLLEIDGGAFHGSKIVSIVLPSTVEKISSGSSKTNIFASCSNLLVVTNLSESNQTVGTSTSDYINSSSTVTFYLYAANTNFLPIIQKGLTKTSTVYLDEPVLSGTLDNGITWTYDPDTKLLSFDGEGEIPAYTAGTQPWYSASYRYGIGGINLGYVTGIGSGAFSGLSFGSSSPLFWGQHESLGGVLSGQTGLPVSYQGTTPTGETEDKTGIWNYVDEVEVVFPDVQPRIQSGEILSPLRFIFQDLGATVIWNKENSYAVIRKEEMGKKVEIVLKPNSSSMWVNGKEYTNTEIGLDATVVLENGRLLLPGRAIIKAWDTVQFKASRPSATVYEDYYFKTSEPVAGGDDKLGDIPVIDEWQEEGTVITPDNEEETLKKNTSSEQAANIIINSEATNFDFIAPIAFNISMLSTGEIRVGSDYQLVNNCAMGPIKIVSIQVNPAYEYSIVENTHDFKNSKAGTKIFGMTINSQEVSTNGNVILNESLKEVIRNKESKGLLIDIRLPAQDKTFKNVIAAVVFTVDFDKI